jgi:hypothetical protein
MNVCVSVYNNKLSACVLGLSAPMVTVWSAAVNTDVSLRSSVLAAKECTSSGRLQLKCVEKETQHGYFSAVFEIYECGHIIILDKQITYFCLSLATSAVMIGYLILPLQELF